MVKQINWEHMRLKIEFLYRLLNYANAVAQNSMKLTERETETITDLISTVGLNLIWVQRINPGEPITTQASINARDIAQVIADEMIGLAEKLRRECANLAPDVKIEVKSEIILQEGFTHIIDVVRNLVEGKAGLFKKEVSND